MSFENKYVPKEREKDILKFWEKNKIFKFDEKTRKPIFSIDTPPPTISGRMHIGHSFSYTQQDFIARYKRMSGNEVYYPFGTDDNGLATEKLVQKERKVNLRKVDRKEAIKIVNDYLEEERPNFIQDWKNIGMSCDFDLRYSTIDIYSQKISQKTFLDLVKKGLIERRKGPVMWDRVFQTAIAQAELEDVSRKAFLNYVKAKVEGTENTYMIYATTRPELCFGVVGMSVEDNGAYVKLKVGDEYWITGKKTYRNFIDNIRKAKKGKSEKIVLSGESAPRKEKKVVKRKGASAIIENVEGDKFLIQKYKVQNGFVGGGSDQGETTEETIRREILEETGYKNIEIISILEDNYVSFGYRNHKDINQEFTDTFYHVRLVDYEKDKCEHDEGHFDLEWVDKDKVSEFEMMEHHKKIWEDFINDDFKFEVVEELKGRDLIGEKVKIPIVDRVVEISHDQAVEADFGTGIAYFCTYGGTEDIEWTIRHDKEPVEVLEKDGRMKKLSGKYEGMLADEARKEIIKDMEKSKDIIFKEEKEQNVNVGERSGVEVEFIVSNQWYVNYLDKKEYFFEMCQKFNWAPEFMKFRLENWIKGLNWDWGFSRQRHFGIPIPVWYGKKSGKMYFADESQLPVDPTIDKPKGVKEEVIGERDVMDTWFTSASTPILATNLVKDEKLRNKIFPMSMRPQAHDIISFWLFYTMAKTNLLYDKNPFENVVVSGWVLDPKGKKMSKSKGNTISPQEIVEKYSNDAIRFAAGATKLGYDQPFQEKEVQSGIKVTNKLYNANKFASILLKDFKKEDKKIEVKNLRSIDKWILARMQNVIKKSTENFENFDYSFSKAEWELFFMRDVADNYLEIVKQRLWQPDNFGLLETKKAQKTLYEVLFNSLKGLAPIMPFITEDIYQNFYKDFEDEKSVHRCTWPDVKNEFVNDEIIKQGDNFVAVVSSVRKYKSENQVSMKTQLKELIIECDKKTKEFIEDSIEDLKTVTGAIEIKFGKGKIETDQKDLKVSIEILKE